MSATDTLTNKPESDEPSSKKAKLDGIEEPKLVDKSADNNNGTTASEKASAEVSPNNISSNNNNLKDVPASSGNAAQIPTKAAANGSGKDSKNSEQDGSIDDGPESEGDHEAFGDPKIASRLGEVEDIQSQISKLNEQASEEILKVEQKFNKERRPFFEKRNSLLKDVPNFWLTTLANHPMIAPMIESAEDEDCLHYMVNLDVEELEDIKSGYNLKFYFAENPYIKNDLIVRELRHINSEEVVTGTTAIEYKDTPQGKSLREIVENSLAQIRRKVRPSELQGSFFAWLSQHYEQGTDEIAEIIKDQIWPSPLEFFFTNPADYDDASDDDSDEDEEDYDDEEEGVEHNIEADIPDGDELAELQDLDGEEFDDEEDDDDIDDEEEGDDDE